jgi:glycosyltransferase involved in cell wall biosynthesis
MPTDPHAGDAEPRDLQLQLETERAAVEHWRRVALQRSEEFAALRSRPSVRVLLGVERRLRPMVRRVRSARRRLRAAGERLALSAAALRRVGRRRSPTYRGIEPPPIGSSPPTRRMAVVLVGTGDPHWLGDLPPSVTVTRTPGAGTVRAALARSIEGLAPDMVGVVDAATEPLGPDWLERITAAIDGTVVAAVPLLVHPCRPVRLATAHDGLVRTAGVGLRLDGEGVPQAVALAAGTPPRPHDGFVDVDAGSGAMLLVDRGAYEAAGGLAPADDLDAAAVELCARLRAKGGRVVVVPSAVAVDHRPVRTRRALRFAADPTGPGWAAAIDRSGALLRRAADGRPDPPARFVVTVAAPSAKVAARWGDWHLAQSLAESLRRLGKEVRVQTADRADDLGGRSSDVHLVLRGLQPVRRTAGQRLALWIISHPETIEDEEIDAADLVLVASSRFADHLRRRTATPVDVMLQAADHRRFRPRPVDASHRHDVTIVAKTRDVLRPVVADALAAGLRPAIYGGGWRRLVDPELVVTDHVDNAFLPVVYSSAGVVLNDHWRTMRAWGFASNRLYDVLACGTPVISDAMDGMDELFDGAVLQYRTPDELRALVDEVLADREGARQRAERGRRVVLANHTFDHRARELVDHTARSLDAWRR